MTALAVAGLTPGRAAPLDPSVCEQLQARLDELRKSGVEDDMAMGPEAARTRLPIDRFNRIGTYIEIDEQLNFRCGLGKQRIVLPTTIEGGEEEIPPPGGAAAAGGATPPAAAAKGPPATKGAATRTEDAPVKRKAPAPQKKQPKSAKAGDAADTAENPAPKTLKKAPAKKTSTKQPTEGEAGQATPAKKAPPKKAAPPKQPAAKVDDAYRPPPKAAARETPGAPAAKQ